MASSKLVLPREETKEEEDERKKEVKEFRDDCYKFYAELEQKLYEEKMKKKAEKEARIRKRMQEEVHNAYLNGVSRCGNFLQGRGG